MTRPDEGHSFFRNCFHLKSLAHRERYMNAIHKVNIILFGRYQMIQTFFFPSIYLIQPKRRSKIWQKKLFVQKNLKWMVFLISSTVWGNVRVQIHNFIKRDSDDGSSDHWKYVHDSAGMLTLRSTEYDWSCRYICIAIVIFDEKYLLVFSQFRFTIRRYSVSQSLIVSPQLVLTDHSLNIVNLQFLEHVNSQ